MDRVIKEGPRIYNLYPRIVGAMKDWIPHMRRAKEMGFNWIYINPFHYPGFSGSIYAIKDYYKFNPLFLNPDDDRDPFEQLREVVEAAEEMDLKLMMDLVINHTSIDAVLLKEHKEWYILNEKGEPKNPEVWEGDRLVTVWGDLAEINNESSPDLENLRKYWLKLIYYYIDVGFHGFRCDAAYKVPVEMWEFLISKAKAYRDDVLFFAETLGCELKDIIALSKVGFDYIFNSSKWWDFEQPWCLEQYRETSKWIPSISFPESHDCERLMEQCGGNIEVLKMRYAFATVFSTGVMMPIGYEYGFRKRLNVVKTMPSDWEETGIDISPFIKKMNEIKASYQVLNEDNKIDVIHTDNPNIFSFIKTSKDHKEKVLVFLNKSEYS
ncbi:MAG: alpha-amylase, partial [Nitrospirae bacterium]